MMQLPPNAYPQYMQVQQPQPSYNAVKIDVHNPMVSAPGVPQVQPQYEPVTNPIYNVPQQSIYGQPGFPYPTPVIVPPAVTTGPVQPQAPVAPAPAPVAPAPAPVQTVNNIPVVPTAPTPAPATVAPAVEAPVAVEPKVDVNTFIAKLTNPDFDNQANAMEEIAQMVESEPDKAVGLVDKDLFNTLLGIMNHDSSALQGPTEEQLNIRKDIMAGKQVSPDQEKIANAITPMEQAERNKQYAMFTIAMLEKVYADNIEKLTGTVVPMTELPGAAGIVNELKSNQNPLVRVAAIDSLTHIQRPEYKQDLTSLFTIAKSDADPDVQAAAQKALEGLK